jgi:hypothetical protein
MRKTTHMEQDKTWEALTKLIPSDTVRDWFWCEATSYQKPLVGDIPLWGGGTMRISPITKNNGDPLGGRFQGIEITVTEGDTTHPPVTITEWVLQRIARLLYLRIAQEAAPAVAAIDGVEQTYLWAMVQHPEEYVTWVMSGREPANEPAWAFNYTVNTLNLILPHNSYGVPQSPQKPFNMWVAATIGYFYPIDYLSLQLKDKSVFSFSDLAGSNYAPTLLGELLHATEGETVTDAVYSRLRALADGGASHDGYEQESIPDLIAYNASERGLNNAIRTLVFNPPPWHTQGEVCGALRIIGWNTSALLETHEKYAHEERYMGHGEALQTYVKRLCEGNPNAGQVQNIFGCLTPVLEETINPVTLNPGALLESTPRGVTNIVGKIQDPEKIMDSIFKHLLSL